MSLLSKMLNPNGSYVTSGDHAVHVRAGRVMAAVVTDTPEEKLGSTPIRDMQEVYVVVSHYGGAGKKSAGVCAIQVVRRNRGGGDPENIYEIVIELGADGAPKRQAAKYVPDSADALSKAVDWHIHIPLEALSNKLGW